MKCSWWVAMGLVLSGLAGAASAADADPNQNYAITPEVGPWTICAASYSGEMAAKLAHDLVLELRTRYQLPAYWFNRGDELRRQQEDELTQRRRRQQEYLKSHGLPPDTPLRLPRVRIEEQYAVLVGGFPDMDSAHRELSRIKKLDPPRTVPRDVMTCETVPDPASTDKGDVQKSYVNPFALSFVVRNPTVPHDSQPAANQPDPFWRELNAGEDYSLLKCPKPYTLAIKEYQPMVVIQPASAPSGFLERLFGGSNGEQLNANAQNAHNLAEALRKVGLPAYVLHTRTTSVVTVGEFDTPNDPKMDQVIRTLDQSLQFKGGNLDLFPRPMPMQVPHFDH